MTRLLIALFVALFAVSACDTGGIGPSGKNTGGYRIGMGERNKIPFRMLDSVNALRQASGMEAVELSAELTAAAATHSQDMSLQNRPWHFGSDGSSPIERVARTGYAGTMLGEVISETFENDVETLAGWMSDDETRKVIMDPKARFMGISWFQEVSGKIWWTMILGS